MSGLRFSDTMAPRRCPCDFRRATWARERYARVPDEQDGQDAGGMVAVPVRVVPTRVGRVEDSRGVRA